jgi:uncharacterized membrane protein YfcA
MNLTDIIVYLTISIISGISIGIVGIGAGILFIPALVTYGVNVKTAVCAGLILQLLPQSLPGLYLYYIEGYVDIPLSLWCLLGSTIGIWVGSFISTKEYVDELFIYRLIFLITFGTALYIGYYYANLSNLLLRSI